MGTSLNGLTPAVTYPGLIKTGDNAPIDGTLKTLSDGNGNNLPMAVSTTAVNFTNQLQQGGVAVPTASQVNAKQDTLVSGTNIKTINGTSVLGSGNIVTPSTNPSGVAGAIQFSNGSAFASDAANLFWDDTNKRLGVRTNTPAYGVDVFSNVSSSMRVRSALSGSYIDYTNSFGSTHSFGTNGNAFVTVLGGTVTTLLSSDGTNTFGNSLTSLGARVGIKGSGSTSATTSLLVQNSAGAELARYNDDGSISFGSKTSISTIGTINTGGNVYALGGASVQVSAAGNFRFVLASQIWNDADGTLRLSNWADNGFDLLRLGGKTASFPAIKRVSNNIEVKNADDTFGAGISVGASLNASAILQASSTTKGFLPPAMTTTQKNAIATPASGLVVYDTTTNKLCCYNGSTWNDLF